MKNKTISLGVYTLLWLVLIILQTLTTSLQGSDETSVFRAPHLYYSTWITDAYLILLFYLNYYLLAPRLMRRHLFRPYLWLTLVAALIGLLLPLLCYALWDMTMPGFAPQVAPISSLGVVGAVAVIALGLCVRGLLEWMSLEDEVKQLRQEHTQLTEERDQLHKKLEGIQHAQLQAASESLQATRHDTPTA